MTRIKPRLAYVNRRRDVIEEPLVHKHLGTVILAALMAPGIIQSRRILLSLLRDPCPSPCDVQIEATRGNPG
jgi:hypothetical protein